MTDQLIELIPIAQIHIANPRPRSRLRWQMIVANIREVGLKKPITVVRRKGPDLEGKQFDLVCGQGRIEAFVALGETNVPAIITEAIRRIKVVRSAAPEDLVFPSLLKGVPMRDNNILTRFIKPAGRKIGLGFVNWLCLRTSHATWLKLAGADVKDAQAQMRHSRASTTMDIYQQFVPQSQRAAVDKLHKLSRSSTRSKQRSKSRSINVPITGLKTT
jgi:integrase